MGQGLSFGWGSGALLRKTMWGHRQGRVGGTDRKESAAPGRQASRSPPCGSRAPDVALMKGGIMSRFPAAALLLPGAAVTGRGTAWGRQLGEGRQAALAVPWAPRLRPHFHFRGPKAGPPLSHLRLLVEVPEQRELEGRGCRHLPAAGRQSAPLAHPTWKGKSWIFLRHCLSRLLSPPQGSPLGPTQHSHSICCLLQ